MASSFDTSIKNKYNKWIVARQQLSFWYSKPISERPDYVKDLEDQANTLEKELTRLSSTFKNQQSKNNITWQTIQQNLKPNEAAIEFVDFNFYNGKKYIDIPAGKVLKFAVLANMTSAKKLYVTAIGSDYYNA